MKALILVGGLGTRLRPITNKMPKHLIPLGNRPLIFYVFDKIVDSGIRDVGLVVSPNNKKFFENSISEYQKNLSVTIIIQEEPLGVAHAVLKAKAFLGQDNFLLYLGDNLFEDSLKDVVNRFIHDSPNVSIVLKRVENPSSFGVAIRGKSGVISKVIEKPAVPPTDLAIVGIYCFTPLIHKAIDEIKPSGRGELEITDAIQYLLDNKFSVRSSELNGWWLDCGTFEDLLLANQRIMNKIFRDRKAQDIDPKFGPNIIVGENTKMINTVIKGPCVIGENCLLENSVLERNTSVQTNSVVSNSHISNSILMNNVNISGLKMMKNSIIGAGCNIKSQGSSNTSVRLILGSNTNKILDVE